MFGPAAANQDPNHPAHRQDEINKEMFGLPRPTPKLGEVCEHGSLLRSCVNCELAEAYDVMRMVKTIAENVNGRGWADFDRITAILKEYV